MGVKRKDLRNVANHVRYPEQLFPGPKMKYPVFKKILCIFWNFLCIFQPKFRGSKTQPIRVYKKTKNAFFLPISF